MHKFCKIVLPLNFKVTLLVRCIVGNFSATWTIQRGTKGWRGTKRSNLSNAKPLSPNVTLFPQQCQTSLSQSHNQLPPNLVPIFFYITESQFPFFFNFYRTQRNCCKPCILCCKSFNVFICNGKIFSTIICIHLTLGKTLINVFIQLMWNIKFANCCKHAYCVASHLMRSLII